MRGTNRAKDMKREKQSKADKNNKKRKSQELRREKKKQCARKRREAVRSDPKLYEENKKRERERWMQRKVQGKIKSVKDMSKIELKEVRKRRKESNAKYRAKQKEKSLKNPVDHEIISSDPVVLSFNGSINSPNKCKKLNAKQAGRKKRKLNRSEVYRSLSKCQAENKKLKRELWKQKKQVSRLVTERKAHRMTPRSKVDRMLGKQKVSPEVRKRLIFSEVMLNEVKSSLLEKTTQRQRQQLHWSFSGPLLKYYKVQNESKSFLSQKILRKCRLKKAANLEIKKKGKQLLPENLELKRKGNKSRANSIRKVHSFFLQDSVSSVCPDKDAYIISYIHGKVKKRKRYLNDNLKSLYKCYKEKSTNPVSYTTFCRLKPFYVVHRKMTDRNTCLCTKCENMKLKVSALHRYKSLQVSSTFDLIKSICCEEKTEACFQRQCEACMEKKIQYNNNAEDLPVKYHQWETISEERTCSNKELRTVKRTVKKAYYLSLKCLKEKFEEDLTQYLAHVYRYTHQHDVLKKKRETLGPSDLFIHMDFSENYACKYNREVQSHYYGASREQITLHTTVAYTENGRQSFCTLSKSSRHDPAAIMAHIKPVIEQMLNKHKGISRLHFQSDSPTTQYRNKQMFYLLTTVVPQLYPQITEIIYNFSEAGHGKGACDGVGGWAKATADDAVRVGRDISEFKSLLALLKEKSKNVQIETVHLSQIEEMDRFTSKDLEAFKGTLLVHQYSWIKEHPSQIYFNSLSCYECLPGQKCSHYNLCNSPWTIPQPVLAKNNLNVQNLQGKKISGKPNPKPNQADNGVKKITSYRKGEWIAVCYGAHWYPGMIEKAGRGGLNVSFLVRHERKNNLFLWPAVPDLQIVQRNQILYHLNQAPTLVDRQHFSVPEKSVIDGILLNNNN